MCERHFEPHLILRESSAFDEKTGRTITCPRDKPGLVPGAVPTLLPGCPSYLSSSSLSTNRPCPTSKAQSREEQHVLHALEASEESFREEDSMWACDSMDDIKNKLHLLQLDLPWTTLIHPTTLHLCFTSSDPAPCIISSINISSDMQATVSLHGALLPSVGDISLAASYVLHEGYRPAYDHSSTALSAQLTISGYCYSTDFAHFEPGPASFELPVCSIIQVLQCSFVCS